MASVNKVILVDDAALHLLIGQRNDGGGDLCHVFGSDALNGVSDELARPLLAFLTRGGLNLAIDARHIGSGLLFDRCEKLLPGLVLRQLADQHQAYLKEEPWMRDRILEVFHEIKKRERIRLTSRLFASYSPQEKEILVKLNPKHNH